jgi:hypothetical protein
VVRGSAYRATETIEETERLTEQTEKTQMFPLALLALW